MTFLKLEQTENTPSITYENGELRIEGNSFPLPNAAEFYHGTKERISSWISSEKLERIIFFMKDFNEASDKEFREIFSLLKRILNPSLDWVYLPENEDMIRMGEIYEKDFPEINFRFVELEEDKKNEIKNNY